MKRALVALAGVVVLIVGHQVLFSKPEVTNPAPTGETIICFGDSLTFGTGAAADESYPAQLARLTGREVINAGVPGDTTASAIGRLQRDVLERSPRLVLLTLGGNDLMREVPRQEAFANLEHIVRRIQDRGALVIIGGIEVPLLDRGYAEGYEDLCAATGCVLIPDVLDDIMGRRDLMADRIHPNGKGYAVMAERFHRAMEPYL